MSSKSISRRYFRKQCPVCNRLVPNFQVHMRVHTNERPYPCPKCSQRFKRKAHVTTHLLTHNNIRPFKCSICNSAFRRSHHLRQHMGCVHGTEKREKSKIFQCIICEKKVTQSAFDRHIRTHTKERPFSCGICEKDFLDKKNYQNHLRIHTGEKRESCIFCGKQLSFGTWPNDHLRSHIREKPFFCVKCPSSFSSSGGLASHLSLVHNSDRPYSCDLCGKSFKHPRFVQLHITTHLNELPYKCTECGKRLKSARGLKIHLESHNELAKQKRRVRCTICSKTFFSKSNMIQHQKEIHGKKNTR